MKQAENRHQIHSITRRWRRQGLKTALVPTMGNLHAGHLALVDAARREADRVITSIYVNPAQFGEGEDFDNYPRTLDADRQSLEQAGCDLLFNPDVHTMYPCGLANAVRVSASPDLATSLEGEMRPGHFDGVVTVVARLFNLVGPDVAVFGEKDYQQLLVIARMADDLGYPTRIIPVPTVREANGLAMSSRNNYLKPVQRDAAGQLSEVLREVAGRIQSGSVEPGLLESDAAQELESSGFRVDYFAIRREHDLGAIRPTDQRLRILAAVWFGKTRLIDNMGIIRVGI